MRSKSEMLRELEAMLREVFEARAQGAEHMRLVRTHGYIDGFMKAMLDAGTATRQELLDVVAKQRGLVYGPATRNVELDEVESAAA